MSQLEGLSRLQPVGFGCAQLFRIHSARARRAVLAAAYDAGVRHFDVAPLYGLGQAESELGEFLYGRRDTVTVTTKFGLDPAAGMAAVRMVQGMARRLINAVPAIKRSLKIRRHPLAASQSFDPKIAQRSLERSLRRLRTEYIDYFFLHEPTLAIVDRDRPLEYLERERARGRIRAFGVAGPLTDILSLQAAFPELVAVIQHPFERCVTAPRTVARKSFVYGCVAERLRRLQSLQAASADARASWRGAFPELSLDDPTLPRLLLTGCRLAADVTALFGSTSPAHVGQMSGDVTDDEIRLAIAVSRWLENGGQCQSAGPGGLA